MKAHRPESRSKNGVARKKFSIDIDAQGAYAWSQEEKSYGRMFRQ